MTEELSKQLEIAMAAIDRQYGQGSVFILDSDEHVPWPAISTGALTLDRALGIGGLPEGRIVEIFGPESSGKTTLALSIIAEAQKDGHVCAFIDAEHALDPQYAQRIGVDTSRVIISQPDFGEQALDIAEVLIGTGVIKVVVIDSVAALTPKAELEGDMEAQQMGLQARLMAKGMRKIVSKAAENKVLVIFINQLREKIGVMFGNPEVTPGGRALKFATSVRIDIRRKEDIKSKKGDFEGIKVKTKIVKNKMAPPFRIAEFDILYGSGINTIACVVDSAIEQGILVQAGSWVKFGQTVLDHEEGSSFAQGRDGAVLALSQDLDLAGELTNLLMSND